MKGAIEMQRKETLITFAEKTFMIFGFTIAVLNVFCFIFGAQAKAISAMFSLGSDGLSVATSLHFLLLSAIISALRAVFFTDMLIKDMSLPVRTVCMFACVIITMVFFAVLCRWFPVDSLIAWVMFFICFIVSAGLSAAISSLREKGENRRIQAALDRFKNGKDE